MQYQAEGIILPTTKVPNSLDILSQYGIARFSLETREHSLLGAVEYFTPVPSLEHLQALYPSTNLC